MPKDITVVYDLTGCSDFILEAIERWMNLNTLRYVEITPPVTPDQICVTRLHRVCGVIINILPETEGKTTLTMVIAAYGPYGPILEKLDALGLPIHLKDRGTINGPEGGIFKGFSLSI